MINRYETRIHTRDCVMFSSFSSIIFITCLSVGDFSLFLLAVLNSFDFSFLNFQLSLTSLLANCSSFPVLSGLVLIISGLVCSKCEKAKLSCDYNPFSFFDGVSLSCPIFPCFWSFLLFLFLLLFLLLLLFHLNII